MKIFLKKEINFDIVNSLNIKKYYWIFKLENNYYLKYVYIIL